MAMQQLGSNAQRRQAQCRQQINIAGVAGKAVHHHGEGVALPPTHYLSFLPRYSCSHSSSFWGRKRGREVHSALLLQALGTLRRTAGVHLDKSRARHTPCAPQTKVCGGWHEMHKQGEVPLARCARPAIVSRAGTSTHLQVLALGGQLHLPHLRIHANHPAQFKKGAR